MNPYLIGGAFVLAWRLWGLHHLWKVPKFHGGEWCFDTPVARDFYTSGASAGLLRAFRVRLTGAFAAELLVAATVLLLAGQIWAFWAFVAVGATDVLYTTITTKQFARSAWKYALPAGRP